RWSVVTVSAAPSLPMLGTGSYASLAAAQDKRGDSGAFGTSCRFPIGCCWRPSICGAAQPLTTRNTKGAAEIRGPFVRGGEATRHVHTVVPLYRQTFAESMPGWR